jgi:amino acid transporter
MIILRNSLYSQIVGLIILGIVLDLGGGPSHDRIGFRYWKNPGAFNQLNGIPGAKGRFLAFWATFINAAFSFLGSFIIFHPLLSRQN